MPAAKVVRTYHDLWQIERSFRITKHDLETRPVHLSLEAGIKAHFLTCFIAQEQIIESLRKYQACHVKDNVFRLSYYDARHAATCGGQQERILKYTTLFGEKKTSENAHFKVSQRFFF